MQDLAFVVARREHAKAILEMRNQVAVDLSSKLGQGPWSGSSRISSIRERIDLGDPVNVHCKTLFVAEMDGTTAGSVAVARFPPGFWKRSFWEEPKSAGLGVFDLAVFPELQRQGVGKFLMDRVEMLASDLQIDFVRLDAYQTNPFSNAFYKVIGYRESGHVDVRGCGLVLYEKRVQAERPL